MAKQEKLTQVQDIGQFKTEIWL